ncbi:MAG TPA: ABC transporter, partial [Gallionella sp.]|nr:ABC transporter [Gallionella sp.]
MLRATPSLQDGEHALAWLDTDLDAALRFAPGIVLVTERRILALPAGAVDWQDWSYRAGLVLQHHDHAGVGTLELLDGQGCLARWRYTLGENLAALRLIAQFERRLSSHLSGQPVAEETQAVCPKCKTALPSGEDECPICARTIDAPPSTWTLLRLWRFAKPYRNQLLAGFLLTLAATAATLVPPYLVMPLMDKVLIPYQNGKPIDTGLVTLLLAGLFGSAL